MAEGIYSVPLLQIFRIASRSTLVSKMVKFGLLKLQSLMNGKACNCIRILLKLNPLRSCKSKSRNRKKHGISFR